jgi:hypothetical protein
VAVGWVAGCWVAGCSVSGCSVSAGWVAGEPGAAAGSTVLDDPQPTSNATNAPVEMKEMNVSERRRMTPVSVPSFGRVCPAVS